MPGDRRPSLAWVVKKTEIAQRLRQAPYHALLVSPGYYPRHQFSNPCISASSHSLTPHFKPPDTKGASAKNHTPRGDMLVLMGRGELWRWRDKFGDSGLNYRRPGGAKGDSSDGSYQRPGTKGNSSDGNEHVPRAHIPPSLGSSAQSGFRFTRRLRSCLEGDQRERELGTRASSRPPLPLSTGGVRLTQTRIAERSRLTNAGHAPVSAPLAPSLSVVRT